MKEGDPRRIKCADEIYPDDGRSSDGKDHKGNWGSHHRADWIADGKPKKVLDKRIKVLA